MTYRIPPLSPVLPCIRRSAFAPLLAITMLGFAACSSTTHFVRAETVAEAPVLDPAARVYVTLPEDGVFEDKAQKASGAKTQQAVVDALQEHAAVITGTTVESQDDALASARRDSCTHVLIPEVRHWEDRATEWSGRRDVLIVGLRLFDAASAALLDEVVIDGRSSRWTFGGDHPEDLLHGPLEAYAASIFVYG